MRHVRVLALAALTAGLAHPLAAQPAQDAPRSFSSLVPAANFAPFAGLVMIERTGIDPATIDDVILGCANQAGEDNRNVARMCALLAGPHLPQRLRAPPPIATNADVPWRPFR